MQNAQTEAEAVKVFCFCWRVPRGN